MHHSNRLAPEKAVIRRRAVLTSMGAAALTGGFSAVHASLPTVGLSLPMTGVQATVGSELKAGYKAALDGLAELVIADDGAVPAKAAKNIQDFASNGNVIAGMGVVSTPSAKAVIPVAVKGQLPLIGLRSGASSLRDGNPYVLHLRASYEEEVEKIIDVAQLYSTICILYHDDDFGRGTLAHAEKVAAANGTKIVLKLPVERNGSNIRAQCERVAAIARTSGVGSIMFAMIEQPAMATLKELRGMNLLMPIFGMSIIATSTVALATDDAYDGMSIVSPYILARTSTLALAATFRHRMKASRQEDLISSPTTFEGFFYGSVLAEAIQRGGPSRKALLAYLAPGRQFDVGQVRIKFDDKRVGYRELTLLRKQGGALRA